MEQNYAVCRVAIAQLRAEPSDKAEIVSQLLFGDQVTVVGKEGNWWMIENAYDNYQGWVDFRQLTSLTAEQFEVKHQLIAPFQFDNSLTAQDGSSYHISAGSTLPFYKDGYCYAGAEQFKVNFEPHDPVSTDFDANVINVAKFFLNTPYLWGGRNVLGLDCSGFVQTVFKYFGIKILRDARHQAEHGQLVDFLSECRPGDVAFFDNEAGNITHVGIMIDNQSIIHASAKVKIDPIDNQGIYNVELGRYTHKLRIIKRFME